MKNPDNDNELFPFTALGAATLNVVRWLEKDREKPAAGDQDQAPDKEVDKQREHQRFVETRLREIERFELRYRQRT